jgi:hypothetical protein
VKCGIEIEIDIMREGRSGKNRSDLPSSYSFDLVRDQDLPRPRSSKTKQDHGLIKITGRQENERSIV